MTETPNPFATPKRGCLGAVVGAVVLAILAPWVAAIRWWRRFQRGGRLRFSIEQSSGGAERTRFDLKVDLPAPVASADQRRITNAVVRAAEVLAAGCGSYVAFYRRGGDSEATLQAIGPRLQELGERFMLLLTQGPLDGRNVLWLALDPATAAGDVIDPLACDPEDVATLEKFLGDLRARWTMACTWSHDGPSWLLRLIVVVPSSAAIDVRERLDRIGRTVDE
jgi:hypothetical protein